MFHKSIWFWIKYFTSLNSVQVGCKTYNEGYHIGFFKEVVFMTLKERPKSLLLARGASSKSLRQVKEYLQLQRGHPAFLTLRGPGHPRGLSFRAARVYRGFTHTGAFLLSGTRRCWRHSKDSGTTHRSSPWPGSWVASTRRCPLTHLSSSSPLLEGFSLLLWSQSV